MLPKLHLVGSLYNIYKYVKLVGNKHIITYIYYTENIYQIQRDCLWGWTIEGETCCSQKINTVLIYMFCTSFV